MDRVIVVGASAGGVTALEKLAAGLSADFPAPILVVLHLRSGYKSLLAGILSRAGPLAAHDAEDGEPLRPGAIYVAQADSHLMIDERTVQVRRGPRENGFRPSVDVLFRSAAHAWGSRAIGVILSGALDDGASGLWAIKETGGVAVVQSPSDADYDSMPVHALRRTEVDRAVAAGELGPLLIELVRRPAPPEAAEAASLRAALRPELHVAAGASPYEMGVMNLAPSWYTCPDCHGVMHGIAEGNGRRFRCHTGHGYTMPALLSKLAETTENALWDAARSVEEAVTLLSEAARALRDAGQDTAASGLMERVERASRKLETLRGLSRDEGGLADKAR